jgi:UrcA family protein
MTRSIFIAATLSVVALTVVTLSGGTANAQDRQSEQVHVSARHVDFSNAGQTRGFYAKLNAAAHQVCTSEVSDPMTAMADAACEKDAVAAAVKDAGAPQLSALHGNSERAPAYATRNTSARQN